MNGGTVEPVTSDVQQVATLMEACFTSVKYHSSRIKDIRKIENNTCDWL
jgi:hypothetical protein